MTLTYLGVKELNYINAYMEHKKVDINDAEVEEYKHNNKLIRAKDVQIKKTMFIVMAISTYLPAIVGPGN